MKRDTLQKVYVIVVFFIVLCATSFSGCINEGEVISTNEAVPTDEVVPANEVVPVNEVVPANEVVAANEAISRWMDTEMTDVVTEETFTLRELTEDGTPVIMHIFATWCPACNMQLVESTTFLSDYPGIAHVVSIDIDASESPAAIAAHVTNKEYAGIFAVAQQPIMQGLIDLFGEDIMMLIPQTVLISGENLEYLGPGVIGSDGLADYLDAMNEQLAK